MRGTLGVVAAILAMHGCRQAMHYNNATTRAKAFAREVCQIMRTQNKNPKQAFETLRARDGRENPKWRYKKSYETQAAQAMRDEFAKCSGYDITPGLKRGGYL